MRKFFSVFFVLSLLATAGTVYWRMAHPEGASYEPVSGGTRNGSTGASGSADGHPFSTGGLPSREALREGVHKRVGAFFDRIRGDRKNADQRRVEEDASERQDWAVTVSIASSLVSAFGALAQVWLTAKAVRSGG